MAGFDLASILSQISDLQSAMSGQVDETKQTLKENVRLGEEQAAAATKLGALSVDQAKFDTDQQLQMEARKKATMDTFNVDILNPDNQLAYLAREQNAAVRESVEESKRAAALRSTDMMSSPLDYFLVRPFADQNDAASKAAATRATVLDKAIDDLNAQTQSTVKTQEAVNETFTAAEQAITLDVVATTAAQKSAALKSSINREHLSDLKTLQDMSVKEVTQAVTGYNLKQHAAEFDARMEEMRANRETRKEEKRAKTKSLEEQMMIYNRGAKELGKVQYTDPAQFAQVMNTKVGQATLSPVIEFGLQKSIDDEYSATTGSKVPSGIIHKNVGEAVTFLGMVKGSLAPSADRTAQFLSAAYSTAKDAATKEEKDGKATPDQVAARLNAALGDIAPKKDAKGKMIGESKKGLLTQLSENPESAVPGSKVKNPYGAPDIATVLAIKPELTQEKWWGPLLTNAATATGTGLQSIPSADQLWTQARVAITSGELSLEEAAVGLSTYHKYVVAANITNEQYQRVGMPTPKAYPAEVAVSSSLLAGVPIIGEARSKKVDMINEQQVKFELAKDVIKSKLVGGKFFNAPKGAQISPESSMFSAKDIRSGLGLPATTTGGK